MNGLIKGELNLTASILLGLILGEVIIRFRLADKLLRRLMPILERSHIPPETGLALAASAGSSKAGAAILSTALSQNLITEHCAVWSVIMLALPSYLRRWPATLVMSVSIAGRAGMFYAVSQIFASIVRFLIALFILRQEDFKALHEHYELREARHTMSFMKKLTRTLPLAWVFFALAYSLVPAANSFFRNIFTSSGHLPLAVGTVAAGSVAHVSAALSLAAGFMASGELSTAQAVFGLVLGSGLGSATRILRMNAGYYFGMFPYKTARKMLFMNFLTIMPPMAVNIILAGIALLCTGTR